MISSCNLKCDILMHVAGHDSCAVRRFCNLRHVTCVMMETHHLAPLLVHSRPFQGLLWRHIHEIASSQQEETIPSPLTKDWASLAWETQ